MVKLAYTQCEQRQKSRKGLRVAALAGAVVVLASSFFFAKKCAQEPDRVSGTFPDPIAVAPQAKVPQPPRKAVPDRGEQPHPDAEIEIREEEEHLIDAVGREFNEENTVCVKTSPTMEFRPLLYTMYYNHGNFTLNDPERRPSKISYPARLFDRLENPDEDLDTLFEVLGYLDSLGVAGVDENGRWMTKVERYIKGTMIRRGSPYYEEDCIERVGNAYMAATRIIANMIGRCIDHEGEGIGAVAERMPDNFNEIFYDLLSIALFEDDISFDAHFTSQFLLHLSNQQKHELFERLYDYALLNDSDRNSYRASAKAVRAVSRDPTTKKEISRLFVKIRREEREALEGTSLF